VGTRGFHEEARSTRTELEKMLSRKISGKRASSGTRLKRLRRTGGAGGIVSLTRDEPGTMCGIMTLNLTSFLKIALSSETYKHSTRPVARIVKTRRQTGRVPLSSPPFPSSSFPPLSSLPPLRSRPLKFS